MQLEGKRLWPAGRPAGGKVNKQTRKSGHKRAAEAAVHLISARRPLLFVSFGRLESATDHEWRPAGHEHDERRRGTRLRLARLTEFELGRGPEIELLLRSWGSH
jgi:hypothetical protein